MPCHGRNNLATRTNWPGDRTAFMGEVRMIEATFSPSRLVQHPLAGRPSRPQTRPGQGRPASGQRLGRMNHAAACLITQYSCFISDSGASGVHAQLTCASNRKRDCRLRPEPVEARNRFRKTFLSSLARPTAAKVAFAAITHRATCVPRSRAHTTVIQPRAARQHRG